MRIGDLKHRIILKAPTKVPDGMGNTNVTYVTKATVWAAFWPLSAKEKIQSMGLTGTIAGRVRIRYRSDIRSDWVIEYKGKDFNIDGPPINHNMENRMLDIIVKAV